MHRLVLFLAAFLCLSSSPIHAQWQNIGDRIIGERANTYSSAIEYINGHVWAGFATLMHTTNDGATWVDRTPTGSFGTITDIEFFDRQHGAVTAGSGVFLTSNGGVTWTTVPTFGTNYSVTFAGSKDNIVVGGSFLMTTTDGGVNWVNNPASGEQVAGLVYFGAGKVGAMAQARNRSTRMMISTDFGLTWTTQPGTADYDSYDVTFDSCSNILFLSNEEWWVQEDGQASALTSTDAGETWNSVCVFPYPNNGQPAITGAIGITPFALYAQTGSEGVLRSTDRGSTWRSIGGPDGAIDAKTLAVVSDNLMYAVGSDGSVWKTDNAGGFPLSGGQQGTGKLAISLEPLFTDSTLTLCEGSLYEDVPFQVLSCDAIGISSMTIEGPDAESFYLEDTITGSVIGAGALRVYFKPDHNGHHLGTLVITYPDGTKEQIPLQGIADIQPIALTASLSSVTIDTLGSSADLHLTIEPPTLRNDVVVRISHDPELQYVMTYTPSGDVLHQAQSTGSIIFTIDADKLAADGPDAIVSFTNVTALPRANYSVRLDSIAAFGVSTNCQVASLPEAAEIDVTVGCGTILLSHLLRNEAIRFTVSQQVNSDRLNIASSHDGHYRLAIIDMLGAEVYSRELDLKAGENNTIAHPPLASGTYLAVIRGADAFHTSRLLIAR